MKILKVEQGSPEWEFARLGIPTASRFDSLLTPKTLKASTQAEKYLDELLAAYLLGQPLEWGSSGFMERGTEMEAEARKWYEFTYDVEVETVGFVTRDDGLVGGSPDGLVGADGILEIKCPGALKHVSYMRGTHPDHRGQTQGYMSLTDRKWCDILSYHPDLPPVVFRTERDEAYLSALNPILTRFVERLEMAKKKFADKRVPRPWHPGESAEELEENERMEWRDRARARAADSVEWPGVEE